MVGVSGDMVSCKVSQNEHVIHFWSLQDPTKQKVGITPTRHFEFASSGSAERLSWKMSMH